MRYQAEEKGLFTFYREQQIEEDQLIAQINKLRTQSLAR